MPLMQPVKRVYTYTDDEGNLFWSMTRLPSVVSPPKRLTLQSRVGTYILNFLVDLRRSVDEDSTGYRVAVEQDAVEDT